MNCYCGKPLHYSNPKIQKQVQELVDRLGENVTVISTHSKKSYKVQRHFIALHGLKESELDTMGFEEING